MLASSNEVKEQDRAKTSPSATSTTRRPSLSLGKIHSLLRSLIRGMYFGSWEASSKSMEQMVSEAEKGSTLAFYRNGRTRVCHRYLICKPCHCHATYNLLFELRFHSNQLYYFLATGCVAVTSLEY